MTKVIMGLAIALVMMPSVTFAQAPEMDRVSLIRLINELIVRIQELQQLQEQNVQVRVQDDEQDEEPATAVDEVVETTPVIGDEQDCWRDSRGVLHKRSVFATCG